MNETQPARKRSFLRRHLVNLKSTFPWRAFVSICAPIFRVCWEYVYHCDLKLAYFFSKYRGPGNAVLNKYGAEVVNGDPEFAQFAKWLRDRIPQEVLERSKSRMLAKETEASYSEDLNGELSEEARLGILRFVLSDKVLKTVFSYCKVVPHLYSANVWYNIAKPGLVADGSQLWHRDGDVFRILKLFVNLSDIDSEAGPFSAIGEDQVPFHAAIPIASGRSGNTWQYGRHTDDYMRTFVADRHVKTLVGPPGTAAWVDTSACYHKGGFCKAKDRLMVHIVYVVDQTQPIPNFLSALRLAGNAEAEKLVNGFVLRQLCKGKRNTLYMRNGKRWLDNPAFLIARRLLTFNIGPKT